MFQEIVIPDGLISSKIGVFEERTSDLEMWIQSGIHQKLAENIFNLEGEKIIVLHVYLVQKYIVRYRYQL